MRPVTARMLWLLAVVPSGKTLVCSSAVTGHRCRRDRALRGGIGDAVVAQRAGVACGQPHAAAGDHQQRAISTEHLRVVIGLRQSGQAVAAYQARACWSRPLHSGWCRRTLWSASPPSRYDRCRRDRAGGVDVGDGVIRSTDCVTSVYAHAAVVDHQQRTVDALYLRAVIGLRKPRQDCHPLQRPVILVTGTLLTVVPSVHLGLRRGGHRHRCSGDVDVRIGDTPHAGYNPVTTHVVAPLV